jgi:hypothetical protein
MSSDFFQQTPLMKKNSTKEIDDYSKEMAVNFLKARNY